MESAPHRQTDEDYKPNGGEVSCVHVSQQDGGPPPTAFAQSAGEMAVNHSPVALTCNSRAHGSCNPVSNANPPPAIDADYNARARTEIASRNDDTVARDIVITINGTRSSLNKPNVTGSVQILITRVDGTTKLIHMKVVNKGWKIVGGVLTMTPQFNYSVQDNLAPGDQVGITCVAEASSDGESGAETSSNIEIIASVKIQEQGPGGN